MKTLDKTAKTLPNLWTLVLRGLDKIVRFPLTVVGWAEGRIARRAASAPVPVPDVGTTEAEDKTMHDHWLVFVGAMRFRVDDGKIAAGQMSMMLPVELAKQYGLRGPGETITLEKAKLIYKEHTGKDWPDIDQDSLPEGLTEIAATPISSS